VKTISVEQPTGDPATDIALDTIRMQKQALIFVNSKRSAEAAAEKVGKKHGEQKALKELSEQVLGVLQSPTKQCRRLAFCVARATAFHHAGLASKQRELVEGAFRDGRIRVIASTPTLAAGINLPAFRTVIRDLKRFSGAGMTSIPILEYHQMAGRSGRPDYGDDYGEAIVIAKHDKEAQALAEQYLFGQPEAIYSKVAALPVLRTYCLSLPASGVVGSEEELQAFFSETFFAHQYQDLKGIRAKVSETVLQLREWGFLKGVSGEDGFVGANELSSSKELAATPLGKRVSELYIDPLSAHELIKGMSRAADRKPDFFSWIHLVCSTQEMRPLLRVRVADFEDLEAFLTARRDDLLSLEPSIYESAYEGFLEAVKTARMLEGWAEEQSEDYLLESFDVRPGELRARLEIADWLCYGASEMARLLRWHHHVAPLQRARTRLRHGAKEELLALLRFKNVGRVRARTLFKHGIRDAKGVLAVDANTLSRLLGPRIAKDLKQQVGQDVDEQALSPLKRKGQLSLDAPRFRSKKR
jgi:helicase